MADECSLLILLGISNDEWHRFTGGVEDRFGYPGGVPENAVRGGAVGGALLSLECICVGIARHRVELPAGSSRRMARPVAEGHRREDQECRDLDYVNGDADVRRSGDPAVCDPRHGER